MGIRWSRGFRSGGVELEDSLLLKGIVRFLGLIVSWRAMSMAGSCVSLRAIPLTGLVWLLLTVVGGAVVSRIVVRGWAVLSVLFLYRGVTEWHVLDGDAEGLFLSLIWSWGSCR